MRPDTSFAPKLPQSSHLPPAKNDEFDPSVNIFLPLGRLWRLKILFWPLRGPTHKRLNRGSFLSAPFYRMISVVDILTSDSIFDPRSSILFFIGLHPRSAIFHPRLGILPPLR